MLNVTDAAVRHLAEILRNTDAPDEAAIRFVLEGRTITPKLDHERAGDATYEYAGSTVLLLAEDIVAELGGRTLDVQDAENGPQLILL